MEKSPIKIKSKGIIEYMEKLKPEIDEIIEKYIPKQATEEWLEFTFGKPRYTYNQAAAQKAVIEPIWDFLERGGKRWRPILFLLIAEVVGGDKEKLKDFVIIPEIIHNGTIIIDDIEDQGELRRGRPCLHKIFGVDIAINAGNIMYFLPLLSLIKNKDKFEPEILNRVYEIYIQEMVNLSFGQGTDIYWHKGEINEIDEKEYLQMCAFKTGCLARMTAKIAVILSGGDDELVEKLGRVTEAIGVGFQIQDDILDIKLQGEEREKFGKIFGNDIKEGKRTLMVIHTLEKANEQDKKRLVEILDIHADNNDLKREAIEIINKYDSVNYAKKIASQIIEESWLEASKLLTDSPAKNRLKEFVYYLIERKV
ncbi:polyprenyl synthetase family protein [Candidatus Parcubacteria bacterium]|nr:polyprenyl synthetase family protein [Candidatus Parcubacteria bacterium]